MRTNDADSMSFVDCLSESDENDDDDNDDGDEEENDYDVVDEHEVLVNYDDNDIVAIDRLDNQE